MSANDSYSRKPVAWPRMQAAAQADPKAPAAVLLGVQWINPLMWRDYPTQWNLLWAQGLAQPNANDRDAARFKLGDAVGELTLGLERKKRLDEILFRYEAPALADAANGALRRDAEH